MLQIKQSQIDAMVVSNAAGLAAELADSLFGAHGFYAPMPVEVRRRLASAAIAEAQANGIDTLTAIVPFVQFMVEMSPRFPSYAPLRDILTQSGLSADEKIQRLQGDDMLPVWDALVAHLETHEDWHLDYWDERIDWSDLQPPAGDG